MGTQYSNAKIKGLLNRLVKTDSQFTKPCIVTSIDEEQLTCDVEPVDGTPQYFDVLLSPTSNSTNVHIPNVGSTVFIHFLDDKTPYVTAMDSINKSIVRATDSEANHISSLKEALSNFATDMQAALDVITFNTPQGPTTPGMLEPGKTQVQTAVDDFIAELDNLFKE